ncbi:PucR family transcriptional regulator [Deinococcus arenicola]|uniref:PucR family transcriptional regulator n=1 Tax=Deinococcus arenicola TaxID=2994950 RepID=A0ABU4DST2_9DEIO|nr:PucR family transcriptional regulator [Deinococcus sp. ZS9-10]MDV6375488.1 PucR family transcriptional regulator [Deinococcus sp. ZS9-10]
MLPTLAEVLILPAFAGAEVRSGHARLGGPITWVHVSEISDAARFLSGGELLLSTGTPLIGNDGAAYIHSLAYGGAHGLALELVREVRELPPAALDAAQQSDFPLIVFRQEVNFAELTRAAHARILRPPAAVSPPSLSPLTDALNETGRAANFVASHLAAVLALPPHPRLTLLDTLTALLACNFNVAESARTLGVRRQTVYYRLEQLRAMLGDLDDPKRQLGLLLALELRGTE